jgi:hypothetical protein
MEGVGVQLGILTATSTEVHPDTEDTRGTYFKFKVIA